MLILDTISKETIWGSDRLLPYGGDPAVKRLGSLYTVSAQEPMSSTVLNGPFQGQTLRRVYREQPGLFGCPEYREFPLLIGFVDAADDLSLQVHPDDALAREAEGKETGKNESWIFLEAPTSGSIVNGCRAGSMEEVRDAVREGRWDDIIGRLPVRRGDYVWVEAGTLHALTAGSLVYEIQQATDVTYRFYDYGRIGPDGKGRPLQLEKAMRALKPAEKSRAVAFPRDGTELREPCYTLRWLTLDSKSAGKEYPNEAGGPMKNAGGSMAGIADVPAAVPASEAAAHGPAGYDSQPTSEYRNRSARFACLTLLSGELRTPDGPVRRGQSLILSPGETLAFAGVAEAVAASPV